MFGRVYFVLRYFAARYFPGGGGTPDPAYTVCLHGRDYRAATLAGAGGRAVTLAGRDYRGVTLTGTGESAC